MEGEGGGEVRGGRGVKEVVQESEISGLLLAKCEKKNWREGKRRLNNEEMTEEPKAYTLVRDPRVISQVEQRLCVMVSVSSNCGREQLFPRVKKSQIQIPIA